MIRLALALALAAPPAAAQESYGDVGEEDYRADGARVPVSTALRVEQPAIAVDGYLDEDVWARAEALTDFVQREPVEGIPAEEDTEVRLVFTEDALYVAARMWDSNPEEIATQLVRRDEWGAFDWFSVSLDPNLDRRTGYRFQISAAGVQRDDYLFNDREEDRNWNAIWESSVQLDEEGWTAELRIPLSQIRYEASADPQTWGVNFSRRRLSTDERTDYALVSRRQEGVVSQFAHLDRTTVSLNTRVNLTVSPTLTFQLFAQPQLSSGDFLTYRQLAESGTFRFRDFQPGESGGALPGGRLACVGGDICADGGDLHVDLDGDGASDFDFRDQDFNFRSLLGNAVLRWEYRPGSTVFLVWQRQQSAFASAGDFDLGRDLDALWGLPADNVFIVKFNYWLSL